MVQEANPLRPIMAPNLGEPILGGLYDLYADALGATAAWWLGHLTIIGAIALATLRVGGDQNFSPPLSAWLRISNNADSIEITPTPIQYEVK